MVKFILRANEKSFLPVINNHMNSPSARIKNTHTTRKQLNLRDEFPTSPITPPIHSSNSPCRTIHHHPPSTLYIYSLSLLSRVYCIQHTTTAAPRRCARKPPEGGRGKPASRGKHLTCCVLRRSLSLRRSGAAIRFQLARATNHRRSKSALSLVYILRMCFSSRVCIYTCCTRDLSN